MGLMQRIAEGGVVLLDGAMGTELERRGVPMHGKAWSAAAMESHAEAVRQVHADYLAAGAEVHIVNSFALGRQVLEPAGFGDRVEVFNRRAVELCRDALAAGNGGSPAWIAGSLSTFADKSDRSRLPRGEALRVDYAEQAGILQAAGVDLFALEMLCDVEISRAALLATAGSGLPVMLGFACQWAEDGKRVETIARDVGLPAQRLEEVLPPLLAALAEPQKAIIAVMHSDFDVTDKALEIVTDHWSGPVAVYPNSGLFDYPNWRFDTVCAPQAFAEAGERWIERGAGIVGGCCGVGPDHIRALAERLPGRAAP